MVDSRVLPLLFLLVGTCAGSFINVLAFRVPAGKTILGRSHCPGCGRTLSGGELVPVLSFVLLRGRCRGCRMRISSQYPLVEILGGLLFLWAFHLHRADLIAAIILALSFGALLTIAVTDARTQSIPDIFSGAFVLCAAAYATWTDGWSLGPLLGGGFFAVQWLLSRGTWVGTGDIILGAGMGILTGSLPKTALALGVAYVLGAIVAAMLLLLGHKHRKETIAFAPFLALGTVTAIVAGERMLQWWNL